VRFNSALPYDIVGGCPGVAYKQNGHLFNNGGVEVEIETITNADGTTRSRGRIKLDATDDLMRSADTLPIDVEPVQDPATMHWRSLKFLVEQYGGTWTDRAAAVKFLEGRLPATESDAA